jgi:prophage regulatory protein
VQQVKQRERERRTLPPERDRILREAEVKELSGLSRTTRWRLIRDGKFPTPKSLTAHAIGWRETEILAWIAACQPK